MKTALLVVAQVSLIHFACFAETVFRAGTDGSLASADGSVRFHPRCFAKGWLGKDARAVHRTHDGGPAIPFKIEFGNDANGARISARPGRFRTLISVSSCRRMR